MDCKSCGIEIPPNFSACLQSNSCPACGGLIVSTDFKKVMDLVKESISQNSCTPEELFAWLITAYQLQPKIDNKVIASPSQSAQSSTLRWANSPTQQATSEFAKNAGLDKIKQNSEWASIVQAVNQVNDGLYGGGAPPAEQIEEAPVEQPPTKEEIQAILAAAAAKKGRKLTAREAKVILDGGDGELYMDAAGNPVPGNAPPGSVHSEEIQAAAAIVENMFTADQSPVLQAERMKRLKSQYTLQNGSGGSFRRGN